MFWGVKNGLFQVCFGWDAVRAEWDAVGAEWAVKCGDSDVKMGCGGG